jgi:hypothetical protein
VGKLYLHLHDRRVKGSGNHDEVKDTEEGGPVLFYNPMNVCISGLRKTSFIRADAEQRKKKGW